MGKYTRRLSGKINENREKIEKQNDLTQQKEEMNHSIYD